MPLTAFGDADEDETAASQADEQVEEQTADEADDEATDEATDGDEAAAAEREESLAGERS